jgi:hypothetical protein
MAAIREDAVVNWEIGYISLQKMCFLHSISLTLSVGVVSGEEKEFKNTTFSFLHVQIIFVVILFHNSLSLLIDNKILELFWGKNKDKNIYHKLVYFQYNEMIYYIVNNILHLKLIDYYHFLKYVYIQ